MSNRRPEDAAESADWRTSKTTPQGKRAIFEKRLRAFEKAAYDLLDAWYDRGPGAGPAFLDIPIDQYPFKDSFDELCLKISSWREDVQSQPGSEAL